jgi:CSLREA domain-containing protein
MAAAFPSVLFRRFGLVLTCVTAIAVFWATAQQARGPSQGNARNHSMPTGLLRDKGRVTPASTITVNSTSDVADGTDGLCTLREAITAANSNIASGAAAGECAAGSGSGSDTINFSVTGTISSDFPPLITSDMMLNGPGASQLTVSAHFRVLVASPGVVTFSGLTIQGRFIGGGARGGGIDNQGTGVVNVTNSVLSNCTASSLGGGIYNAGTLNISNSTLSRNHAGMTGSGAGGGIYNAGILNITNSTLTANTTDTAGGGGIYNGGGTANITNCTLTNNTADSGPGGGIHSPSGSVQIRNTIIALNTSTGGFGISPDVSGAMTSFGHNLIGLNLGSSGLTNGVNGDIVGNTNVPINPLLGNLANNGGPTQTLTLLPGSPAIDAGDNCVMQAAHCGDPNISQLTTDQRGAGFNRVVNTTVDIGAFESRGFTISAASGTPQSATITTAFTSPLVATVSSAFSEPVAGGMVTFTAPASGPSGKFPNNTLTDGVTIASGGTATSSTFRANATAGGPYSVVAGGKGIAPSASFSLTNTKAATSTGLTSSSNPSDFGQIVTFTATVASFAGTPTGTVQFKDNSTNLGAAVALNASGVATLSISSLSVGTHSITADYSGDLNFLPSTGALGGGQTVNPPPSLSINDVSLGEGDNGTKTMNFTVTLSAASSLTVTVDFATADGTATAPSDYVAANGALTFNPGNLTKSISVTINGDQKFEADETFTVNLTNAVNATLAKGSGSGTILNDDAQGGIISLSQSSYSLNESAGLVTLTVNRSGDISNPATVDYATDDGGAPANCGTFNGFASSRCDFTTAIGTLRFAGGESQKTFVILVGRDSYSEGPEMLSVALSNQTGGAAMAAPSSAIVTIDDSPTGPPLNPIDDASNFVRQHYHDFLNREADQSGLGFWTKQITSCGSDAGCVEVARINVSAAFFLSIEFQQTGYLVERTYKVAYNDANGISTLNGLHQLPVPVVRFNEFLKDTQRIGQGMVVLAPGWEQVLENNKQAYMREVVQSSRFIAAFPTTMTPAQFVDKLNQNAGNVLSANERTTAINLFAGAAASINTTARAQAVRMVAEDQDLYNAEFNRAFVLAEYFGYLRRNPNDAPESTMDYTGYDFWVTKLNQFNGDYINSEMVKAFLSSIEYRQRFGR